MHFKAGDDQLSSMQEAAAVEAEAVAHHIVQSVRESARDRARSLEILGSRLGLQRERLDALARASPRGA